LLYATGSALGGTGLGSTSVESARGAYQRGFLGKVGVQRQSPARYPCKFVRSLHLHPVRALSSLDERRILWSEEALCGLDCRREVRQGDYDFFHGWSGDSFQSLVEARLKGIPSAIEIPTWHRNKGSNKRGETQSEREARLAHQGWKHWRKWLPIMAPRCWPSMDLVDVILQRAVAHGSGELPSSRTSPRNASSDVARGVDPGSTPPAHRPSISG